MGLAIETGLLADLTEHDPEGAAWLRQSLANANEVLAEYGLPTHDEPEQLPPPLNRSGLDGFPYSFVHYLRRAYAYSRQDPNWVASPFPADADAAEDPLTEEVSSLLDSHLLCHSDCEGFYLPIPFEEILIDTADEGRVVGGLLGSSYQLLQELQFVAPRLGITLDNGSLPDTEANQINEDVESEAELWIERSVWLAFFEAARLSIEHKTAICFA